MREFWWRLRLIYYLATEPCADCAGWRHAYDEVTRNFSPDWAVFFRDRVSPKEAVRYVWRKAI